jgi:ribonuclease D
MSETEPELVRIDRPRDGLPDLIDSDRGLRHAAEKLAEGTGPIALDAERASGFRFSQRAYLIQVRRASSGTFLIDPIEFENLNPIQEATKEADWILHAASQDLLCLAEVGLVPKQKLFDTELAGRLLGLPRVGLGTLAQSILGISLAKEHSAADWSTRPLPEEWLSYAALDVEFLDELWALMSADLQQQNKFDWALEEFEHIKSNTVHLVRTDPWRRLSGIHKVKDQRQLAIARELWNARLHIARELDIASGRILNDAHIVAIAQTDDWQSALTLPFMKLRGVKKHLDSWALAYKKGLEVSDQDLPPLKLKSDGPPNPRNWQNKHPEIWEKLESIRAELSELAELLVIPVENIISPETVRRIVWQKPVELSELEEILAEYQVRYWQRDLVRPVMQKILGLT